MRQFSVIKDCDIGENVKIFDMVNLFKCKIGNGTKVDSYVYIEENVIIGENCKIRPFTFIPTGVKIGNNVFLGPNITFTNDKFPRTQGDWEMLETVIGDNVSIGAGSVILPGITIGKGSMIGAGSVVTKSVPENVLVFGNPAKIVREL